MACFLELQLFAVFHFLFGFEAFVCTMFKLIVIAFAVVSVAMAAKEAPKEFTIGGFLEGSWVVAKKVVDIKTGNIIEEGELAQFNVTKTNDDAYDIFQLEKGTYYRKQDLKQVIMLPTSPLTCEIQEFNSEKDSFEYLTEINLVAMMPGESFVRNDFGCELDGIWHESL